METLVAAINGGDWHSVIMTGFILLLSNYATDVLKNIIGGAVTGLHYLADRASTQQNQILGQVEKRLLDKVAEAVEGMMPLADDLKKLTSEGKLTPEDIKTLQGEAFKLFIDNLTPKDWVDFATHLVDPTKADAPKEFVAARLEKRFKALHTKALTDVKLQQKTKELLLGSPDVLKKS
jgi:hypothetical protein